MNDIFSIFSDVSWLMKETLVMNISGYIEEVYFPGLRNVMNFHLWQLKNQFIEYMQATFDYYPGLSVDEGDELVFIKNVY